MPINKFFKIYSIISLYLLSSLCYPIAAQESITLTYSDMFSSQANNPTKIPMLPKSQRVSKDASTIVLTNPSLGEQIDNALEYAISVWEASILGCDSILIEVEVADIEEDIRTYVNYDYIVAS